MKYYIYNNTGSVIYVTDVHISISESFEGEGTLGLSDVLKIAPKSWGSTSRCSLTEVESSLDSGCLKRLQDNKHVVVLTRQEYEDRVLNKASEKLEKDMGIKNVPVEEHGFGFLSKAIKKEDNINNALVNKPEVTDSNKVSFSDLLIGDFEENNAKKETKSPINTDPTPSYETRMDRIESCLEYLTKVVEKNLLDSKKKSLKKSNKKGK